tara:strand:- start:121 stop:258 length:138 start_codon:yes stop_codon:yes gene_type:complete
MYQNISNENYNKMLIKIGKAYMPPEPKKKKLNLRQIFFLKGKGKK